MPVANTTPATLTDLLFEKTDAGLCLVAPDGTIVRANAEWLRSTELTEDQVVGENIIDLFPATRDTALAMHARARAGHRVEVPRHALVRNGRETWWEGTIEPVAMEGGTGLLITGREVTGLPRAPDAEAERRSSELLRAVADSIPDPIFVKDTESRVLFANPATLQVIGKPGEQVIGKTDEEIYADREVGATVVATDRSIMESGEAISVEERIQTPAGYRFFLSTKAPFRDADGKVVGLVGVARDISERKRAEAAVRESEARYRQLFQNMLEGFAHCRMIFDEDGRAADFVYLDVNGAFEHLTGLRNVVGKRVSEVIPGIREEHPELLETYGRVASEGKPERFEIDFRPLGICLAIAVYQPQPDHFVAVFDNITERKRVEEALRLNEERLRAAFAASPDAININRLRDGAYVAVNERFERLSLWSSAEAIGKTVVDLNVWVDMEERARLMTSLLSRGLVQNAETAFRRKDGSVFTASISAQLFEANGERFLLAITRDISELKRAEQALRDADRRKDEFLGMLSHELRNPLAPVRNSLYVLDHVEPGGQQARRAKAIANRQIAHMTRIVDDLLDVTRIGRGKIELRCSELDLGALARRTAEDHRALMEDKQIALAVEVQEHPVVVNGDETRLAQVLGNLLHNAAKFTHVGGQVTLGVAEEQGKAVIHVRDTGTGMAPEVLPTIFQPFAQGKQTLARSEGGLGLGLALVKGLVELHGGSVSAASDGLGKGATFTITLPLDVTAARVPARPGLGVSASPRRVLVIEDNHDAANSLREVLELDDHVVEVAYSGRDGIEKARAFRPDVVLCDIGLPEMDGYEVARTMRADPDLGRIGLVALSGYAQPEDVAMAKEVGFDAHLAKPPSIDALERALAEVGNARQDEPGTS
jgi:PAS domain S-box-containing protein